MVVEGKKADYAVVGAGLAGSELVYQLGKAGKRVLLFEMRPERKSLAHETGLFAELVCSNSFRSANPENAVGLLKEEMALLDSLVIKAARAAQVPAGDALAVDRRVFAETVTREIRAVPSLEAVTDEVLAFEAVPNGVRITTAAGGSYEAGRAICATGPLSSARLYDFLNRLFPSTSLYFYDSIAPIVDSASLNRNIIYPLSRYGKGGGADYLNCPLDKDCYERFVDALLAAEKVPINEIDRPIFFEACLPVEVMAERGRDTLRFGPMKPVGLEHPQTGVRPYAVVQLRVENKEATCYNIVGFQTRLKQGEQKRVFSLIPGLEQAEFLRYGAMHRNTYLESPLVLNDCLECPGLPRLHFAGQITGVEGYVESAAVGLLLGKLLPILDQTGAWCPPPPTTAFGALYRHLRERRDQPYAPNNVHFGLFSALEGDITKKARKAALVGRARADFNPYKEKVCL